VAVFAGHCSLKNQRHLHQLFITKTLTFSCDLHPLHAQQMAKHATKGYFLLAQHIKRQGPKDKRNEGPRTCDCRTNMPWLSSHVKYFFPCTEPLFFPFASSSTTPIHLPGKHKNYFISSYTCICYSTPASEFFVKVCIHSLKYSEINKPCF